MRTIWLILLTVLLGCKYIPPPISYKAAPEGTQVYAPIVKLKINKTGTCTGTVIATNYVLSAAHCFKRANIGKINIQVKPVEDDTANIPAKLASLDEESDLALVTGDFSQFKQMRVITEAKSVIETIETANQPQIACGFPWTGEMLCAALRLNSKMYFQYKGPGHVYPGMSGGPVIDSSGYVIGVIYGVTGDGEVIVSPLINLFDDLAIYQEQE